MRGLDIDFPEDGSLHWTARQYLEAGRVRPGYVSFAVVRDPVDRFLSAVNFGLSRRTFWHVRGGERRRREHQEYEILRDHPLVYVVEQLERRSGLLRHRGWWPQHVWLTVDGALAVDYLLRFETLEQDLSCMLRRLGLERVRLPHLNRSDPIRRSLPEDLVPRVKKLYQRDYQLFDLPAVPAILTS